jgi:hypothetical protein
MLKVMANLKLHPAKTEVKDIELAGREEFRRLMSAHSKAAPGKE